MLADETIDIGMINRARCVFPCDVVGVVRVARRIGMRCERTPLIHIAVNHNLVYRGCDYERRPPIVDRTIWPKFRPLRESSAMDARQVA